MTISFVSPKEIYFWNAYLPQYPAVDILDFTGISATWYTSENCVRLTIVSLQFVTLYGTATYMAEEYNRAPLLG